MMPRWVIDTPYRLTEVARIEQMIIIRKLDGVWHAALPWANRGRGESPGLQLLVGGDAGGAP